MAFSGVSTTIGSALLFGNPVSGAFAAGACIITLFGLLYRNLGFSWRVVASRALKKLRLQLRSTSFLLIFVAVGFLFLTFQVGRGTSLTIRARSYGGLLAVPSDTDVVLVAGLDRDKFHVWMRPLDATSVELSKYIANVDTTRITIIHDAENAAGRVDENEGRVKGDSLTRLITTLANKTTVDQGLYILQLGASSIEIGGQIKISDFAYRKLASLGLRVSLSKAAAGALFKLQRVKPLTVSVWLAREAALGTGKKSGHFRMPRRKQYRIPFPKLYPIKDPLRRGEGKVTLPFERTSSKMLIVGSGPSINTLSHEAWIWLSNRFDIWALNAVAMHPWVEPDFWRESFFLFMFLFPRSSISVSPLPCL